MTAYANGRLPASALTRVQSDAQLYNPTARAWKRLVAATKKLLGRDIRVAGKGGAYRPYGVQEEFFLAGQGNKALAIKWGLNPNSSVAIAGPGHSTHGLGTRVDIVGTVIDAKFLAVAAKFGFTREFGARDPNHFMHDGKTATSKEPTASEKAAADKAAAVKKAAVAAEAKRKAAAEKLARECAAAKAAELAANQKNSKLLAAYDAGVKDHHVNGVHVYVQEDGLEPIYRHGGFREVSIGDKKVVKRVFVHIDIHEYNNGKADGFVKTVIHKGAIAGNPAVIVESA